MYTLEIRPAWLEIDLDLIKYNLQQIQNNIDSNCKLVAVIKADAYGHGAVELAKFYRENSIEYLVVSILSEALELRKKGVDGPILILNYTPSYQFHLVVKNDLIASIYNYEDALSLSRMAESMGKLARIHIKIDSGMGRLGFLPTDETVGLIEKIVNMANLDVEGIFTHFSRSDEIGQVNIGDEAILFWKEEAPRLDDLAAKTDTIVYESLTMLGRRLPRVYVRDGNIRNIVDYLL